MNVGLCIELFFPDLPYKDRIKQVRDLGFKTREFWFHNKRFDGKKLVDEMKDFDQIAELNGRYDLKPTNFVFNHPDGGSWNKRAKT